MNIAEYKRTTHKPSEIDFQIFETKKTLQKEKITHFICSTKNFKVIKLNKVSKKSIKKIKINETTEFCLYSLCLVCA